ncbi:hypothetical protein Spb1_16390 [Planctopirus ephydatiae]|uniref:Uncharacterized protein n=1 Tax=Planctopirus ephydatiae TaxID=2528019 RepID=A0A518GMF2_9PLAN|nr:hypothetical protein Spb1_16390 [Planctopirus ephydatiae]
MDITDFSQGFLGTAGASETEDVCTFKYDNQVSHFEMQTLHYRVGRHLL